MGGGEGHHMLGCGSVIHEGMPMYMCVGGGGGGIICQGECESSVCVCAFFLACELTC